MIKPEDMYNVASVALLLAHKMEDAVSWSPNRIRERCGLLLPLQQFLALERQMLQIFDFQLNFPTALCFLRRFSQVSSFSRRPLHLLAKYLIEKCQLSSECASWLPSVLAAACLYVSARVLLLDSNGWNGHLEYYSGYTLQQVRYFAVKVACFLKISDNWVLNATNLKYSSKENMNVATCCELRRFINCFDPSSLL